jgi:hypothetical protein
LLQQIINQLGGFLHLAPPPPPPPPQEQLVEFEQIFNQLRGFVHLSPPPPPPPQEPPLLLQDLILPEPVEHQVEQVELFGEPVEVPGEETIELESSSDDNEIIVVAEIGAPERRRRPRRVRDEAEYVVESVLDRRYFHRVEQFLIKWTGYDDDENSWEDGHEKRREIPDAISLYFQINGIADDGLMLLQSRDEEFVEDRQPRERPFLARAVKRPRFS